MTRIPRAYAHADAATRRVRGGPAPLVAAIVLLATTCGAAPSGDVATAVEAAGAASAAVATVAAPDPAAVLKWCGQEQEGTRMLAEALRRRERELDERQATVATREAELTAAEARLAERLAALEALRGDIAGQLDRVDQEREARIEALVKMVETNRAATIAPMLAALEPELATEVLDRMNRQKAGKLLGALPPDLAARLAERMTRPLGEAK